MGKPDFCGAFDMMIDCLRDAIQTPRNIGVHV
jgi:hypothetical protein